MFAQFNQSSFDPIFPFDFDNYVSDSICLLLNSPALQGRLNILIIHLLNAVEGVADRGQMRCGRIKTLERGPESFALDFASLAVLASSTVKNASHAFRSAAG